MNKTDTRTLYDKKEHTHLDFFIDGEYPESGLLLIKCFDGRCFIEVDFGRKYNEIAGISKPEIKPYQEPQFFDDVGTAARFAFDAIIQVYPEADWAYLEDRLSDIHSEED